MDPALRCKDEQEINECLRTEQHECLAVANSLVKCSTGNQVLLIYTHSNVCGIKRM